MSNTARAYDLISMGRSGIDLYANEIGAPFTDIQTFAAYVGGCPTNIAVGARRLGLRTALLTAVGEDPVGDFILNFLREEGVETRFIPRKPGARSSAALLGIEPPDRFPLVFYRDNAADVQVTMDDVLAAPMAECRALLVTGTGLSREPARSATLVAMELARAAGATVFLDLDLRADQWHDPRAYGVNVRGALPLADVALGTEEEVKAAVLKEVSQLSVTYSQVSSPEVAGDLESAVRALLDRGPWVLAVKRGQRGASIYQPDAVPVDVPGFAVKVFNTLGAGDAFASGFIYGWLKGWDMYRAARMGNANGALVVTRHGCSKFMGYEDEVLKFVEAHGGF